MNEYNPAPASTDDGISAEERQWAMFAHLSALLGALVTAGWAGSIGCFIGPLVIWLMKKDTMPFVDDQAKEALNFNITVAIAFFVLFLMTVFTLGIGIILTGPLFVIVGIGWLVLTVIASIKANQGERYRYPLTLRLVK
ncbi:MAG TPA: DUF4870 domain-containing protein [Xanthomonadaceae bacterium]|nr:DUF4870 domain-containing protein [Xanthomonadaceae bacterium]